MRLQDDLLNVNPLVPQGSGQRVRKGKGIKREGGTEGGEEGVGGEEGEKEGRGLDDWSYFCLDRVRYHNRWITVVWDRDGTQYNKGKGMSVSHTTFIPCPPCLVIHSPYFLSIICLILYLYHLFTPFCTMI